MNEPSATKRKICAAHLKGLGLGLLVIAIFYGGLFFGSFVPFAFSIPGKIILALGGLCALTGYLLSKDLHGSTCSFATILIFLLLSDNISRGYNFLQGPSIRGEILLGALLTLVLAKTGRSFWFKLDYTLPFLTAIALASAFLLQANGRLIFSDDHPAFLERLWLLKEHFPNAPFFNPLWNAGYDARDFLPSGALGVFLLFSPLIYSIEITQAYNLIVLILLFGITPLATFYAARLLRATTLSAGVAATLTLCSHLYFYRWSLSYGTLGFITSLALYPLVVALSFRAFDPRISPRTHQLLLLATTTSILLFWTPAGLALVPLIILPIARFKLLLQRRSILLVGALILLINGPWIALFWSASKVGSFVEQQEGSSYRPPGFIKANDIQPTADRSESEKSLQDSQTGVDQRTAWHTEALKIVRGFTNSANPILLLGALGLVLTPRRYRALFCLLSAWLTLLAVAIGPLKPQLEFDRMLLFACSLLTIPTGQVVALALKELKRHPSSLWKKILAALTGGVIFASVVSAIAVVSNRTPERYYFAEPIVNHLATAIKELGGAGRTVFSGFVLHDLSHGHITPLPLLSGKALVASSPVHRLWRYTQVIPKEYLTLGDSGIRGYLRTMNASSVVAHERYWREYFSSRPQQYRLVWSEAPFSLFEIVNFENNYFLEGEGDLLPTQTGILITKLNSPSAIIKFNYFPFLESPQCKVTPYLVSESVTFIRLTECSQSTNIEIRSVSPWRRLWLQK